MQRPPPDPRHRPIPDNPIWRGVLVSYAALAAIPLLLWVASQPVAGTVALAAVAGLFAAARRAYGLVRCFADCRGFAFDLAGRHASRSRRSPPTT